MAADYLTKKLGKQKFEYCMLLTGQGHVTISDTPEAKGSVGNNKVWGWRVWGCCVCEPSPSPPPPPPPSPTAAAAAEGGGYVGAVGVFRGGWRVSSARGAAGSV
ncbi:unnamed protein product [Closterium sp. NIES-54]